MKDIYEDFDEDFDEEYDEDSDSFYIQEALGIQVRQYGFQYAASFPSEANISLTGFGDTPLEAKYDLVLKVLDQPVQYMDKIQQLKGLHPNDIGILDLMLDIEFFEDGSTKLTIKDSAGRKRVFDGPRTKPRNKYYAGRLTDNILDQATTDYVDSDTDSCGPLLGEEDSGEGSK